MDKKENKWLESFSKKGIVISSTIWSLREEHADLVSKLIEAENKVNWEHMFKKSLEDLLNNKDFIVYLNGDELIWYMWINEWDEVWSLVVSGKYKGNWFWKEIMGDLFEKNKKNNAFLITNVGYVIKVSEDIWLTEINKDNWKKVRGALWPWKKWESNLLPDDRIFVNYKLVETYEK
jgi:hypothetical protein